MTAARRTCTQYLPKALKEYERWRLHEAGFSPRTWAGEKPGLLAFVDYITDAGVHYCNGIKAFHINAWWSDLGLSENTRATRLNQLRVFVEYCIHRGWMEQDPTVLLRAPRPAPAARERLTAGELLELIELAPHPHARIVLAIAANTAMRTSEIRDLRLRDVHLDRHELTVRVQKTRTPEDPMPVSVELDRELRRWLDHYMDSCAVTPRSFLVPGTYYDNVNGRHVYRPDRAFGVNYAAGVVKEALVRLGWETTLGEGIHTVRRSIARLFFDAKEAEESFDSALLATMELLHHVRSETTLLYIGQSRGKLARDSVLKGKPFLTTLAPGAARNLRAV